MNRFGLFFVMETHSWSERIKRCSSLGVSFWLQGPVSRLGQVTNKKQTHSSQSQGDHNSRIPARTSKSSAVKGMPLLLSSVSMDLIDMVVTRAFWLVRNSSRDMFGVFSRFSSTAILCFELLRAVLRKFVSLPPCSSRAQVAERALNPLKSFRVVFRDNSSTDAASAESSELLARFCDRRELSWESTLSRRGPGLSCSGVLRGAAPCGLFWELTLARLKRLNRLNRPSFWFTWPGTTAKACGWSSGRGTRSMSSSLRTFVFFRIETGWGTTCGVSTVDSNSEDPLVKLLEQHMTFWTSCVVPLKPTCFCTSCSSAVWEDMEACSLNNTSSMWPIFTLQSCSPSSFLSMLLKFSEIGPCIRESILEASLTAL